MAAEMKMVSLKRTPEDMRKDAGEPASIEAIAPDYPYGTVIHLDKDELDKLKISALPKIGDEMIICARVNRGNAAASAACISRSTHSRIVVSSSAMVQRPRAPGLARYSATACLWAPVIVAWMRRMSGRVIPAPVA